MSVSPSPSIQVLVPDLAATFNHIMTMGNARKAVKVGISYTASLWQYWQRPKLCNHGGIVVICSWPT